MKKILVIGSLNLDMVANVDHCPGVGETILTDKVDLVPGGKGANQAYAAGKLGAKTAMLGAVGADSYGELLRSNLASVQVDVSGVMQKKDQSTGMAFITVNKEGDNSITVVAGANGTVSPAEIDQHISLLEQADLVLLQMEIPVETVCHAAKTARAMGKTVILDPAPVPKVFPEELYQYADLIKPNETELSMLTGIDCTEENVAQAAAALRAKGVKHVVVTLGDKGVYLDSEQYGKQRIPALKVKAVDTTAAGDTFTAAVAVMLASGKGLPEAVSFANRVSSIVVTRKGAQSSIPGMDEVEAVYGKQ